MLPSRNKKIVANVTTRKRRRKIEKSGGDLAAKWPCPYIHILAKNNCRARKKIILIRKKGPEFQLVPYHQTLRL